ncbi:MBL fold metallo-hydrolase [Acrocarpospora corrugata]|uniref:MBL fold metallo-hydrolase n=1 Tax=Acrocarpospora corrugata TaxID=35763 RepID=A0A5M3W127_9ACTN|nr:MBL fold metallo-hydrolase [Acrocarpospora corrugata]GES01023.1 MBL fold metallo-hydrolase [Acrocarpospora corrugata]
MAEAWWVEVGDGIWVRRHTELDLSLGLIIGERSCLVIDTGGDESQGSAFATAIRELTDLPWTVALTHAHFDHSFGTAAFDAATVWAHPACRHELQSTAEHQRQEWATYYQNKDNQEISEQIRRARIVLPVPAPPDTDLGNRIVRFIHPGPAHTNHDLAIHIPDAHVVFAGDLLEQGAPPAFGDAFPASWPQALNNILAVNPATLVPGHGNPVTPAFARAQQAELAQVAHLCRLFREGTITAEEAIERSPYPAEFTSEALDRG